MVDTDDQTIQKYKSCHTLIVESESNRSFKHSILGQVGTLPFGFSKETISTFLKIIGFCKKLSRLFYLEYQDR